MRWIPHLLPFLFSFILAVVPVANVPAQNLSSTPVAETVPTGILAEFDIDELPSPTAAVLMVRTTIAADFESASGMQNGPLVLLVESGTLVINVDAPVEVNRSGNDVLEESGEIVLETGSSALVPKQTSLSYANLGDEGVHLLMLLIVSDRDEGQGDGASGEIIQIADRGVAVGTGDFPPIAGSVRIERVVAKPGETLEGPGVIMGQQMPSWMGVDIGMVETGSADLTVSQRSFHNMILPDWGTGSFVAPVMFTLSATDSLDQGDSYTSYNSALTWTVTGDEPLTILRAIITPEFFP